MPTSPKTRRGALLPALAVCLVACAHPGRPVPADPEVNFALHRDGGALVIDRLPSGAVGTLASPGWLHGPDAPRFILRLGDEPRGALWVVGRSRVLARREPSTVAPRMGDVVSAWEEGAIRLTLFQTDGPIVRTDRFVSEDGRTVLSRTPGATALVGTFRAVARDGAEQAVGWLRVRLEPDTTPLYDGVLPPAIEDALVVAAALALDAEIAWLDEHAAR